MGRPWTGQGGRPGVPSVQALLAQKYGLEYEIPKFEGDLGQPNVFVPVEADVADRKVELLMQHFGTQRSKGWFRPETFRALMALRAVECNAAAGWAEAFHVRKLVL